MKDYLEQKHQKQLENISRYPDQLGINIDKLELIAREAWIIKNGCIMSEPDIILLGDGKAHIVEYKNTYQLRGEEQIDRARQYLKQCKSLNFDTICTYYVIGSDLKLQLRGGPYVR